MMRKSACWLAVLTALATAGALSGPAGAAAEPPAVYLSSPSFVAGQTITILGSGWKPGTRLQAALCGGNAVNGLSDCDLASTQTVVAQSTGSIWQPTAFQLPAQPCPCVVLVTGPNGGTVNKIPVTVIGAPTGPIPPVSTVADLQVQSVRVTGGLTLASAFGGAAERTVSVEIYNPGNAAVTPVLTGRWGRGSNPQNVIAMAKALPVQPGRTEEVRTNFTLSPLSVGEYTVRVEMEQLSSSQRTPSFSTTTANWPIGLFAIGLLIALAILAGIAVAVRVVVRRIQEEDSDDSARPQVPTGV